MQFQILYFKMLFVIFFKVNLKIFCTNINKNKNLKSNNYNMDKINIKNYNIIQKPKNFSLKFKNIKFVF